MWRGRRGWLEVKYFHQRSPPTCPRLPASQVPLAVAAPSARPKQPPREGGGKAAGFSQAFPLPRTSGREHLPLPFVARAQAGLAPICRRPRPPPHLCTAPQARFPASPPPAGLGSHGSGAGSRSGPSARAAGPAAGVPEGRGAVPRNAFQAAARP